MAANMALKRFKKAQKRKQVVAEKRKLEVLEASLPAMVRRAAATPIQHCLLTGAIFENGFGSLLLARGPTPYRMTLGLFLIDTFCLGIKDAVVRMIGSEEFGTYVEAMEGTVPLVPVDPSYARKLVREAAAWAQSIGFPPHRDFAVAEQLFGDTDANACDANFPFGQDGKPFYVPGPSESTALIRRRMAQLRTTGEGNFLIGIPEEMARSTFVARPPPEALDDLQEDHDEADDGDAPGGGA